MAESAKSFGLSETPVREAIRRLESEGYIDFTPHMGAIVTKIDEGELVEIYLIRIALEELATRLAGPHIVDKDIDFLNRKNHEMEVGDPAGPIRKSRRDEQGLSSENLQGGAVSPPLQDDLRPLGHVRTLAECFFVCAGTGRRGRGGAQEDHSGAPGRGIRIRPIA